MTAAYKPVRTSDLETRDEPDTYRPPDVVGDTLARKLLYVLLGVVLGVVSMLIIDHHAPRQVPTSDVPIAVASTTSTPTTNHKPTSNHQPTSNHHPHPSCAALNPNVTFTDIFPEELYDQIPAVNTSVAQQIFEHHDATKVREWMAAAFNQEPVMLLVFGGSLTGGTNCNQPDFGEGRACSWPIRVANWVRRETGNKDVVFANLARGGTRSGEMLPSFKHILEMQIKTHPNHKLMVMFDFSINDSAVEGHPTKVTPAKFTPARSGIALEMLVDITRQVDPDAALFGVTVGTRMLTHLREIINLQYRTAFRYKDVPNIIFWDMEAFVNHFWVWSNVRHPNYPGHIYFANLITHSLTIVHCGRTTEKRYPVIQDAMHTCKEPLSMFSAYDGTPVEGTCELTEDRPGKPGYICTGKQELRVKLQFGEKPELVLTSLVSYENIDDAVIKLNGINGVLSGKNPEHNSVTTSTSFPVYSRPVAHIEEAFSRQGFQVPKNAVRELVIRPKNGGKIKLMEIMSC